MKQIYRLLYPPSPFLAVMTIPDGCVLWPALLFVVKLKMMLAIILTLWKCIVLWILFLMWNLSALASTHKSCFSSPVKVSCNFFLFQQNSCRYHTAVCAGVRCFIIIYNVSAHFLKMNTIFTENAGTSLTIHVDTFLPDFFFFYQFVQSKLRFSSLKSGIVFMSGKFIVKLQSD